MQDLTVNKGCVRDQTGKAQEEKEEKKKKKLYLQTQFKGIISKKHNDTKQKLGKITTLMNNLNWGQLKSKQPLNTTYLN